MAKRRAPIGIMEGDPVEQNRVWADVINVVSFSVPVDWSQVVITYRAVGDHTELVTMVRRATNGDLYPWQPPEEVSELLAELRAGMYRRGRGTWFQVTTHIHLNSECDYRYTWDDRPSWDREPPVSALLRELELFPRDESMVPAWLADAVGRPTIAMLGGEKDSLRRAEEAVAELGLDPRLARVGEVADGAWCLVREDGRWHVFLAHGEQRRASVAFDSAAEATRYFVGNLYLHREAFRDELPPDAKRHIDEWPIQPLGGDIKLTLYKGKRLVTLPPGTELDRYGDPSGNTLYAAGTEFPYRSHPESRARDEYHVYRLRYAVRALTGTAVPWFDQPGGGVAFLLERPVADLVAEGVLEEIPHPTLRPPAPSAS